MHHRKASYGPYVGPEPGHSTTADGPRPTYIVAMHRTRPRFLGRTGQDPTWNTIQNTVRKSLLRSPLFIAGVARFNEVVTKVYRLDMGSQVWALCDLGKIIEVFGE